MSSRNRNWTKEETMLAFELYCIIPKGKDTANNPQVQALATAINRTPDSVKLKLQNFKSYDPSYTQDGRVGLSHGSKLDGEVCKAFLNDWDALIVETNEIKAQIGLQNIIAENDIDNITIGRDRIVTRKERVGQSFFRQALLAAYNYKCCFTGIAIQSLLRASHIKPWSESNDINEKANPRNGLLLNALHDSAFDNGYMTITTDYRILISKELMHESEENRYYFLSLNGKQMTLPSRFLPDKQFIEYHNNKFKGLYA
jgi:putative restriction endonuclease